MLKRKIISQIEEWHQYGCRKALLLTGARQVGKTTSVREFAKQHYTHFVEVNFVKHPVAQQAFDGDLTTKAIVANLSAMGFGPFVEGKTLVFFDDARFAPADSASAANLQSRLSARASDARSGTLLLLADRRVPAGDLMKLMALARKAGLKHVQVAERRE